MLEDQTKQYRSVTLRVGATVLLQFFLMRFLGWNGNQIFYLLTGEIADEVIAGVIDSLLYLFCFMFPVVLFRLLSIGKHVEPMHLDVRVDGEALLWMGIGLGLISAMAYIGNLLFGFVDFSVIYPWETVNSAPLTVVSFVSTAVVPAVAEEFLYRGCVCSNLLPYGKQAAVFGSAFLFAVMHSNPLQFLYAFCAGLVLGACFVETGSIWPGMFLHLFNNFLGDIEEVLTVNADAYYMTALYDMIEAFLILGGLLCAVLLLARKNGQWLHTTPADNKRKGASLSGFFSVTIIVFVVFCALRGMDLLLYALFPG